MLRSQSRRLWSGPVIAWGLLGLLLHSVAVASPPVTLAAATAARARSGPFPGSKVATVRFFAMNLDKPMDMPRCPHPVAADGRLCESVVTPGVTLSAAQAEQALTLVRARTTYSKDFTKCFLPHHALVFFDAAEHPVGFVSICFMCQQAAISPALPRASSPAFSDEGYYAFSAAGMEHLRALCRAAGLPYCDAKSPKDFASPDKFELF